MSEADDLQADDLQNVRSILVPVDGSEHARKAMVFACDLAGKYGARLTLLHVVPRDHITEELRHAADTEHVGTSGAVQGLLAGVPEAKFPASMRTGNAEPTLELLEFVGKQVLDGARALAARKGIQDIQTAVDDGDPARRILARAKQAKADLIVMGSRGLGDFQGLLVGSVSHKVSHLAECTCITVK